MNYKHWRQVLSQPVK